MTRAEERNNAKRFLSKAREYLETAQDSFDLERPTAAAGNAIHAGISAKDAIVTIRMGTTSKGRDHSAAVKALGRALAKHPEAANAERALRELVGAKSDVEYGTLLISSAKAESLIRRAPSLVDLAEQIVLLER